MFFAFALVPLLALLLPVVAIGKMLLDVVAVEANGLKVFASDIVLIAWVARSPACVGSAKVMNSKTWISVATLFTPSIGKPADDRTHPFPVSWVFADGVLALSYSGSCA